MKSSEQCGQTGDQGFLLGLRSGPTPLTLGSNRTGGGGDPSWRQTENKKVGDSQTPH